MLTELALSATADPALSGRAGTIAARRVGEAAERDVERQLSLGFVGTYPPTRCGIATFTMSLAHAVARTPPEREIGVVSSVDAPRSIHHPPEVTAELVRGSPATIGDAASALDRFDAVVVQHEFGIYGGPDGREILDLVARLTAPVVVVLHTVLAHPSPRQRAIVDELGRLSAALVVQTEAARSRLLATHDALAGKVHLIRHGATADPPGLVSRGTDRRPLVLTWGLIGPTKGIEFAIDALAGLRDLVPLPRYLVLGQTHPRVLEREGERYRESLASRARALGVHDMLELHDGYLKSLSLLTATRAADVVVLPYLDREQVVSGVLVEAIASGTPVVATRFPHAVELLDHGSGILVSHESSTQIASALRTILTDPGRAAQMAAVARAQGKLHAWEAVAHCYCRLASEIVAARADARS